MAVLVLDPDLEARLKAERQDSNSDGHDEVWEGTYVMAPLANNDHQDVQGSLVAMLKDVVGWDSQARVCAGVNVSDREHDWTQNYRDPDVVVFLPGNSAQDRGTHWLGGPDFLVEILSPKDRSHDKLPFYAKVNVREALYIDREPWTLELYRLSSQSGRMELVQRALPGGEAVSCEVLPISLRLLAALPRPRIEVCRTGEIASDHAVRGRWTI